MSSETLLQSSLYKLRSILIPLKLRVRFALCGGDGSGGISALILRLYNNSRVIFNSLCDYQGTRLKGNEPAPPSAISHCTDDTSRCVNFKDCWANPNDLSKDETWRYFLNLLSRTGTELLDLLILDMEVRDINSINQIEDNLIKWYGHLGKPSMTIIFKTYITRLYGQVPNILTKAGEHFTSIKLAISELSSSQTSEVYVIMQGFKTVRPIERIHPNMLELLTHIRNFPLFSSEFKEFIRAQTFRKVNLNIGIPEKLMPDPLSLMMRLLENLGVRADLSYRYTIELCRIEHVECPISLFILVIHSLIPFTTGFKTPVPIPSDGTISNLATWIIGFTIWLGYTTKSFPLCHQGQELITKHFPFYFDSIREKYHWYPSWSLHAPLSQEKIIQLDSKLGVIGSIIRCLRVNFPKSRKIPNPNLINSVCTIYNKSITYNLFESRTNIISWWGGRDPEFREDCKRVSLLMDPSPFNSEHFYRD